MATLEMQLHLELLNTTIFESNTDIHFLPSGLNLARSCVVYGS